MSEPWLSESNTTFLAITLAAGVVVAGLFSLRKLPRLARFASIALRLAVLALFTWAIIGPIYQDEREAPPTLILLGTDAPREARVEAYERQRQTDGQMLNLQGSRVYASGTHPIDEGIELADFMRSALARGDDAPASIEAWLPLAESKSFSALAQHRSTQVPLALHPYLPAELVVSETGADATASEDLKPDADESDAPKTRSLLELSAPVAVSPGEPFSASLYVAAMREGAKLSVEIDDVELDVIQKGEHRFETLPIPLAASDTALHTIRARLLFGSKELAVATRSIAVTEAESVVVLSNDARAVETWNALLPSFEVIGIDAANTSLIESAMHASRALVLPLDLVPDPSPALIASLNAYAEDGGLVFVTGPLASQMRKKQLGAELIDFLPVTIPEPPPPQPSGDVQPKVEEAEVSKVAVVLAIDNSGSTLDYWDDCTAAVESAMGEMENWDRIGAMIFSDVAKFIGDADGKAIPDYHPSLIEQYRKALVENHPKHQTHLQHHTDILKAARKGVDTLKEDGSAMKLLIVISDGDEWSKYKNTTQHSALSAEAHEAGIAIITIRFGSSPAQFMDQLATQGLVDGRSGPLSFAASSEEIPRIVVNRVKYAYDLYDEQQDEEEAKRKEQAKLNKEREKLEQEALEIKELIPGRLALQVAKQGRDQLGITELPHLGLGLAGAKVKHKSELLFLREVFDYGQIKASESGKEAALVYDSRGFGGVLYFAAPLDNVHAGSWLADPNHSAELLEDWIRRYGRSRSPELYPLARMSVEAGRLSITPSNPDTLLEAVAITRDGSQEYSLDLTRPSNSGEGQSDASDTLVAFTPPDCEMIEIRTRSTLGENESARSPSLLAFASALPASLVRNESTTTATLPLTLGDLPEGPNPLRSRDLLDTRVIWFAVFLSLLLLPIERYLRRT